MAVVVLPFLRKAGIKMRIRLFRLSLIAGLAAVIAGCASTPPADTSRAPVQVYPNNPFVGKPYDVAGRIWTGTWKTAYGVPVYATRDEAIASMQNQAAGLNAGRGGSRAMSPGFSATAWPSSCRARKGDARSDRDGDAAKRQARAAQPRRRRQSTPPDCSRISPGPESH